MEIFFHVHFSGGRDKRSDDSVTNETQKKTISSNRTKIKDSKYTRIKKKIPMTIDQNIQRF